jgi:putative spermidine/putrescine transport system substrate-binding protein
MEKKIWKYTYCLILPFLFMAIGCGSNKTSEKQGVPNNWPEIEQKASNQTVTMMMWQGDPLINTYMKNFVVPTVKDKYGIDLEIVPGQGNQIVSTLISEQEAGAKTSQLDMMWINGETFYQLRKIKALHGPFVDRIPNNKYINWDSPFIRFDFQQVVDGYECPWGNVPLAIISNSE